MRFLNDDSSIQSSGTSVQSRATAMRSATTHRERRLLSSSGDCGTPGGAATVTVVGLIGLLPGYGRRGVIEVLIGRPAGGAGTS